MNQQIYRYRQKQSPFRTALDNNTKANYTWTFFSLTSALKLQHPLHSLTNNLFHKARNSNQPQSTNTNKQTPSTTILKRNYNYNSNNAYNKSLTCWRRSMAPLTAVVKFLPASPSSPSPFLSFAMASRAMSPAAKMTITSYFHFFFSIFPLSPFPIPLSPSPLAQSPILFQSPFFSIFFCRLDILVVPLFMTLKRLAL